MNIIEHALKMEKDGEAYYRELASKAGNKDIEEIFIMLADVEAKHYESFLQLKNNQDILTSEENILPDVKNVFQRMSLEKAPANLPKGQIDAYMKARNIERESRDFYLKKYEETSDPIEKELCMNIAEEEQQHYIILDNIINFMSHPDTWLEDAEWSHMDTY